MEQFASYELLGSFTGLVMFTFTWVQATKEMKAFKSIKTDLYAWIVAFVLVLIFNLHSVTIWNMNTLFAITWNIPMYVFTALFVSMSGGKLSTINEKKSTQIDKE